MSAHSSLPVANSFSEMHFRALGTTVRFGFYWVMALTLRELASEDSVFRWVPCRRVLYCQVLCHFGRPPARGWSVRKRREASWWTTLECCLSECEARDGYPKT